MTYTEYDTDGNKIYQTTGDYAPGSSSASQSRTSYDLYNGESVTLGANTRLVHEHRSFERAPLRLYRPDGVVTQLTYDSGAMSLPPPHPMAIVAASSPPPPTPTTPTVSRPAPSPPTATSRAPTPANYTTSTVYNADGKPTSVTLGGASGHTVVPRVTTYTYDADNNVTATGHSTSPNLIGTTTGSNAGSTLSLALPAGTKPGDKAVLTTTTSASPSGLIPATANDIYAIVGNGTSGSTGVGGQAGVAELDGPEASITDAAGDVYIATDANCVDEVPATSSTQWGQTMTAGDLYTVAGTCGSSGHTGDGAAATSALLHSPQGLALDANGDLYIGDFANNRVQEVAATTHSQWGQSMTANDIYTVAGSSSGISGHSGDGGAPPRLCWTSRSGWPSTRAATSTSATSPTTGSKRWRPAPPASGASR